MTECESESVQVKHMKLHAHGAVVTKSDVRMPEDGSGDVVVNMPAKVYYIYT